YVVRADGTGMRQIGNLGEPVTEIALSGDASTAFAVTASNRMVRIDVATGSSQELIPPTPYLLLPNTVLTENLIFNNYRFPVSRGEVVMIEARGFVPEEHT